MTHSNQRQVVVAYDFEQAAEEALGLAVDLACREPSHVLHVVVAIDSRAGLPILSTSKPDYAYAERIQQLLGDRVREVFAGRNAPAEVHFFVHARFGNPTDEVLGLAKDVGADLILIGSHGRTGVDRLVLGSVSEKVVREAKCPVMVVRPKSYEGVELLDVVNAEHPKHHYVKPHRYGYSDNRVQTRPSDWPIN